MSSFEQLHPWCIIRPLPNMQRQIVARCRRRNDAESHLQVLRRLMPNVAFAIAFDIAPDDLLSKAPAQSSRHAGK